jgi:hypothetical protein
MTFKSKNNEHKESFGKLFLAEKITSVFISENLEIDIFEVPFYFAQSTQYF